MMKALALLVGFLLMSGNVNWNAQWITSAARGLISIVPMEEEAPLYTQEDAAMLARVMWTESRGVKTMAEQAAVCWCVLNRVDSDRFPDTIEAVVTAPHQFIYYPSIPLKDDFLALALDVLERWAAEKRGEEAGRTLPSDYFFFGGDDFSNRFRKEYDYDSEYWDWSLPDPYEGAEGLLG